MKFKTQKSVTDKITSNNLNSMGFNSFFYCVQHLAYCLLLDTLKLIIHPVVYGVKAEFPITLKPLLLNFLCFYSPYLPKLLQCLMSISELLQN